MSITARRIRSPIGRMDRHEFVLRGPSWTLREVAEAVRDPQWPEGLALGALVNGELVDVRTNGARRLEPGDDVTISPAPQGLETTLAIVSLALTVGSVIYSIVTAPGRNRPIGREDEESPTYRFSGIGTQRGPGAPIAMGYGSMRVGQQFISSQTIRDPRGRWTDSETILVQVALGIGPWKSIGGLDLGACGESDYRGGLNGGFRPLPAGIRLNDTEIQIDDPNVVAHVRSGSLGQSPMPHGLDDVSTIYGLTGYELKAQEPRVYTTSSDEVDRLVIEWQFPQGLYRSQNGAQVTMYVDFDVRFRKAGDGAWGVPDTVSVDFGEPALGTVSWTKTYDLPEVAQWQVELLRNTPDDTTANGGNFTVSQSILDSITEQRVTRLAYPSVAVLGLEVQGNERVQGSLNSVTVPCDMRMLRRYSGGTWSAREWLNADDPNLVTGKNPAWQIADMITLPHYGGGALGYEDADLDLQSFQDFADYCDELVPISDTSEPRHQCSIYFDSDYESLDDAIGEIVSTCRAAYVREGSLHYVAFDHVKDRSLLLTSERVSDVKLRYRNRDGRPTSYIMQILDEDQDYDLVEINVEDKDALIDVTSLAAEELWQERINLKGCTRRSQAVREAEYRHRANYYRDLEVEFSSTRYAIPLRIFDRFALSLHVPRWYASVDGSGNVVDNGLPYNMRIAADGSSVNSVYPDRQVAMEAGNTYAVAIQLDDDTVEIRNVTNVPVSGSQLVGPGYAIEFDGAAISFEKDAQIVLGETDEVVIDFICLEKTYDTEGFKVTIKAEKYDERVYEEAAGSAPLGTGEAISELADAATLPAIDRTPPQVSSLRAQLSEDGRQTRVQWVRPKTGSGYRFRVYSRLAGSATSLWTMHKDTSETEALIPRTQLGLPLEISVTSRPEGGTWAGPDSGVRLEISGQEFPTAPPPNVISIAARAAGQGFVVTWDDVPTPEIDYYEIRRGPQWFGGSVVARVRSNSAHVRDARMHFKHDATRGENYMVRARHRNGLYSPDVIEGQVTANPWDGFAIDVAGSNLDLDLGSSTGTCVGCTVDSSGSVPVVRMDADTYEATYTLPYLEPTTSAQRWWSIAAGVEVTNEHTMGDLAGLELGETHFWTLAGRDPSPQLPGSDSAVAMDSTTLLTTDPTLTCRGRDGVVGHMVCCTTELRIYDHGTSTWGAWQEWTADTVTARRVQGRVRLERASLKYGVALTYMQMIRAN